MSGSVNNGGQIHQRIEPAQKLVDRIDRRIFGDDFRKVVAKGDGYRTVEIGTDMRRFVGDLESIEAGVFDNMIILAVIDDLHIAIRKVSRAPARTPVIWCETALFQGGNEVVIRR